MEHEVGDTVAAQRVERACRVTGQNQIRLAG